MARAPLAERFWALVARPDDEAACWLWRGRIRKADGYGTYGSKMAHRVAWELLIGPLPSRKRGESGMELDHRCRTRHCVNPSHLQWVTHAVNVAGQAVRVPKRQCPSGHPYDDANTYVNPNTGRRSCRACGRESGRRWYDRTQRRPRPESLRTQCPQGHPYDESNTAVRGGKRFCKTCAREWGRQWYAANRERVLARQHAKRA